MKARRFFRLISVLALAVAAHRADSAAHFSASVAPFLQRSCRSSRGSSSKFPVLAMTALSTAEVTEGTPFPKVWSRERYDW